MTAKLIADIGGTRARLALSRGPGDVEGVAEIPTADHPSFEAAARAYLDAAGLAPPDRLAVAVAGPVTDGRASLTNAHWDLDVRAIGAAFGGAGVSMVNDFEAIALALPLLGPADATAIGGGSALPGAAMAVLGPGTGLGVAGLLVTGDGRSLPVPSEGGHMTLAACDDAESELIANFRERFGHVSAERALSGAGLECLYAYFAGGTECAAAEVAGRAAGGDAAAVAALDQFAKFLGTVAADLALAFGARGGVFLAGGMLPRLGGAFPRDVFRARFEDKGRFGDYLADIPTALIVHDNPGLIGLTDPGQ